MNNIGPEKVITYRCNNCKYMSRNYEIGEGWFNCYCKDVFIGCFYEIEDIWPEINHKCPEIV